MEGENAHVEATMFRISLQIPLSMALTKQVLLVLNNFATKLDLSLR